MMVLKRISGQNLITNCNDPGAYGKIFKLYLWKSVNSDPRATKNKQLFQFNGILFKVVQVVQNKIEAYPFLG